MLSNYNKYISIYIVLLLASLFSYGCGFRPIHSNNLNTNSHENIQNIYIPKPKKRIEQLVRNHLLDSMLINHTTPSSPYHLIFISYKEKEIETITRNNGDTDRIRYNLIVKYKLTNQNKKNTIIESKAISFVSYDRLESEFANLSSLADARNRATQEIAQQIKTRISAYFMK